MDLLIVERGLADTRQKAQALIMAGSVLVDGKPATKPGVSIPETTPIQLKEPASPYVSRGGIKLEGAIQGFQLAVEGRTCLDIGSSTGGFTQCLLMNGARHVTAVDVDVRQLDWKLQQDPRVTSVERNARFLKPSDLAGAVDLVTIDASFISLELILPVVPAVLKPGGACVALVKPQFEVGRERVGKGGIVRDDEDRQQAILKCIRAGEAAGLRHAGTLESPITGREGNREFFLFFHRP